MAQMAVPPMIGSYRIERLLGTGSFATVWLGFDPALGGRVAIKVLAENWSHDLRVRERFQQEARLLFRLNDPRLVRVHGLGELPDGRPYSVMDWADGGSLRELLAAGPVDDALGVLREIAAGVAVLHRHRIVHRDLSPGNVLFRSSDGGQVLIADLGLAKALAAASGLTARAGTPGFMAPEQNDALAMVDTRADVYGLGRLGAALLGDDVPAAVRNVLRRATEPRPEDRYRDAAAFGSALERACSDQNPPPAYARRPLPLIVGVLVTVALLTAVTSDVAVRKSGVRTASDGTGRITVTLPDGWYARGSGWAGRPGIDGRLEPALVMSPDPQRWLTDPAVPGAFVGVSDRAAQSVTPAGFVAQRPHASCVAAPVQQSPAAGIDWVVARFTCATGKPMIIEAAGLAGGSGALVYLQIAALPDDALVSTLLTGITIR